MQYRCAYCRAACKELTAEHIWPQCIIQRVPTYEMRYSSRAKKVIKGDLVVKDVCARCNNGPLSALDSYICSLFDRYFHATLGHNPHVEFEYDWGLLGRWLLKISFNASRLSGVHADVLSNHADIILGEDLRPPDLAIWLDLLEPCYLERRLSSGISEVKTILPLVTRVCQVEVPGLSLEHYIMRLVSINAFAFFIAVPIHPYQAVDESELQKLTKALLATTVLNPEETAVAARSSGVTFAHLMAPHFEANRQLYVDFMRQH